jgi:hypothetical protein
MLRARGATHGLFHYELVEKFLRPLLPAYAKIMKQRRLTADQAAVALVTDTIAKIEFAELLMLQVQSRELCHGLAQLYLACVALRSADQFAPHFHEVDPAVAAWLTREARQTS